MAEFNLGEIFKSESKGDKKSKIIQWIVLGSGVLIVFGLSLYGWVETYHAKGHHVEILELLQESWETVTGKDYIVLSAEPESKNWALTAAGFGAKLLLVLGAATIFFQTAIRRFIFSRKSGHTVICGMGERGTAIARAVLDNGGQLALIEMNEESDGVADLRRHISYVVTGNALDSNILREAGVRRAARVIAVTDSDENNLAIIREAGRLGAKQVVAGVEEFELRSYFRDRVNALIPGCPVRLTGFQCRAARKITLEMAMDAVRDPLLRKSGVSLLIDATGDFRDELIRAAALMLQISGDVKPRIHIASATPCDRRRFEERFPAADLVVDLKWNDGAADEIFPEAKGESPDFALFALKDDAETLETAERFRIRHNTMGRRVIACLRELSLFGIAADAIKDQSEGTHLKIHHLYGLALGDGDPLDEAMERDAKPLHEDYCRRSKKDNPKWNKYTDNWNDLQESVKDSNRLQAFHHCVKREAWKNRGTDSENDLLIHLGRSEHMRWMAEKVMDGWRGAGTRKDELLRHNLLIPYDALSQPEKEKDLNPIRVALGLPEVGSV
jgi:Trk K+ transport system NAD-binding subunit